MLQLHALFARQQIKYYKESGEWTEKYLKDEEFIDYVIKHINEFITIKVTTSKEKLPVHIIWDAFKEYIRGIIISFSARKKAELNKKKLNN